MRILTALLMALGCSCLASAASGAAQAGDWRLEAFDEANDTYMKMQADEHAFLVGKEPALEAFYRDVMVPWQTAMLHLRRIIFVRKLQGKPELLNMNESPWKWALSTPSRQEEIQVWLSDDRGGEVQAAYKDMMRKLGALRPASQSMQLSNDVAERFRPEVNAIEGSGVAELNALEERVLKHLAGGPP